MSETNLMTLFPSINEPPWALSLVRKIKIDSQGIRLISWLDIWTAVSSAERHALGVSLQTPQALVRKAIGNETAIFAMS